MAGAGYYGGYYGGGYPYGAYGYGGCWRRTVMYTPYGPVVRRIWGQIKYQEPARFFQEISDKHIEFRDLSYGGGAAQFRRQTEHVAATCRATPPRPGFERVRLPGESGLGRRAAQLEHGVELHSSILPGLEPWARKLGVSIADFGLRIAD